MPAPNILFGWPIPIRFGSGWSTSVTRRTACGPLPTPTDTAGPRGITLDRDPFRRRVGWHRASNGKTYPAFLGSYDRFGRFAVRRINSKICFSSEEMDAPLQ